MSREDAGLARNRLSRRAFLEGTAAATVALGAGAAWPTIIRAAGRSAADTPIRHIVVSMQENRSFDHYFGYAPWVGRFGPGPGYSQPDGNGGTVAPYHFASLATPDIPHSWNAVHAQWDGGKMDGFYTTDGLDGLGYYLAADLPFYYSLFDEFTLCGNSFCSLLGPTWPNRFYLMAGTSGGITTNGLWGFGIFDYPMILDLLEAAGISWKIYNIGMDSVPFGNTDNVAVFWKRWAHDRRTLGSKGDYLNDLRQDRLPQVSFIIPSFARGWDEHPPADVTVGMGIQEELVTALRQSSAWSSAAYLITYDEHGGYFDHVPPPQIDDFGLGIRVPTWVISPYAKPGHIEATVYDATSILKFIERVFGLPTLASVNHQFDERTPAGSNYEAAASGAAFGPPAPPRDGLPNAVLGDLFECFTF